MTSGLSSQLSEKIAAEVDFISPIIFQIKQTGALDRVTLMALAAASQALDDFGITLAVEENGAGVYLGMGMRGSLAR